MKASSKKTINAEWCQVGRIPRGESCKLYLEDLTGNVFKSRKWNLYSILYVMGNDMARSESQKVMSVAIQRMDWKEESGRKETNHMNEQAVRSHLNTWGTEKEQVTCQLHT